MTATRFVAIPSRRTSEFFGERLPIISINVETVRVSIPPDRQVIDLPRATVNVVSDHPTDTLLY